MKQLAPAPIAALALILAACSPGTEAPAPADAPAAEAAAPGAPVPTQLGEALLEADGFMPANPGGHGTGRADGQWAPRRLRRRRGPALRASVP